MDTKPLIGLGGVLLLALTAEFNDQVITQSLPDIQGGLHFTTDPGSWFSTVFVGAQVVGMAISPWWAITVSLRRMTQFVALFACLATILVPLSDNLAWLYSFRVLQGLSVGLTIPLLMTTALRVLGPEIRLVGLACYALTATFSAPFATSLASLWVDAVGDYRFAFLEAIPLCLGAWALMYWGMPEDEDKLERLGDFDIVSFLLLVASAFSLVTLLEQGDRYDWFDSKLMNVLMLITGVCLPIFLYRQWVAETPFFRLQLLGKRNVLFGVLGLIFFLLIALSGTQVPTTYLQQVQGYRPEQAQAITLVIALLQFLTLPLAMVLLDRPWIDARWVVAAGLACIFAACLINAHLSPDWNKDQFYLGQVLEGFGYAFVIMPVLMLVTNVLKPEEGPFASALFNTPRALTEAFGVFLIERLDRVRGALHRTRLAETLGQAHAGIEHSPILARALRQAAPGAALLPKGRGGPGYDDMLMRQVQTFDASDIFVVLAGLCLVLGCAIFIAEREAPPRIALAGK